MSGRGRGRGRGAGNRAPDIKDDDGQYVTREVHEPPPNYPANEELPARQDPSKDAQQLKAVWRALSSYWKHSPYNLQLGETKTGLKRTLDDFVNGTAASSTFDSSRLAKVLTLHPRYFPEELYTSQEKRASKRASSSAAQKAYWAVANHASKNADGLPFDRLARLEAQRERAEEDDPTKPGIGNLPQGEGNDEEEDEQDQQDVDEPDEEDYEDDDYLQGAEYDDDEGYEDDALEDHDDGGAYY